MSGALKWKDIIFRHKDGRLLSGWEVPHTWKLTRSVLSTKNKLQRCTRTTSMVKSDPLDAVKILVFEYTNILARTVRLHPRPVRFRLRVGRGARKVPVSGRAQQGPS